MPRTSKKHFSKEFKNKVWGEFLKNISDLKAGKDLDLFLNKYLTPNEKLELEKRLGVLELLKSGFGCRQTSREMDVTPKTVCFIKNGFRRSAPKSKLKNKKLSLPDFLLKKNSKFPSSYGGKRRNGL